jgi:hypothetical protein
VGRKLEARAITVQIAIDPSCAPHILATRHVEKFCRAVVRRQRWILVRDYLGSEWIRANAFAHTNGQPNADRKPHAKSNTYGERHTHAFRDSDTERHANAECDTDSECYAHPGHQSHTLRRGWAASQYLYTGARADR